MNSDLNSGKYSVKKNEQIVIEPIESKKGAKVEPIITVKNVTKRYGKLLALDNVSLNILPGLTTALLGPNGAGKTTLVQIMATLQRATKGTVTVAGLNVVKKAQQLRSLIGLTGQYAAVDEKLTGQENLEIFARLYHLSRRQAKERARELLAEFELKHAAKRPLKNYSGGMRRRLDLAASLIIKPKILFLDEPTTGLDPRSRFAMWNIIRELTQQGTTVLLTTQYLEEADQLADKIFVMDKGKIISEGTAKELKQKVGGEILEVHLSDPKLADQAARQLARFAKEKPHLDKDSGIVTAPLKGGPSALVEVVRALDENNIKIVDVVLRRPTLDDVFLKLTSHTLDQ